MGIDIYPGGAHWAYSGFHRFRHRLAEAEGFDLSDMQGFGGEREWTTSNGDVFTPLTPLLNHSDCEGYLNAYECEQVLPRLRAIIDEWASRPTDIFDQYDIEHARNLIAGMEHSVLHGCAVVFS